MLTSLGFPTPPGAAHRWLYCCSAPWHTGGYVDPLFKAMFYHDAYCFCLALKLKRENPEWGATRIRHKIRILMGVWIPTSTIKDWIRGTHKPNITPLKVHPELGYVVGVLMSDCGRTKHVSLFVKDKDFVLSFVKALEIVTGKSMK